MAARTQIFCASGPSAVVTMVAAVEAGRLPDAERRMLLVCDDSPVPEAAPAWDEVPGFGRLRARFDAVLSWNETVRPFHPAAWTPPRGGRAAPGAARPAAVGARRRPGGAGARSPDVPPALAVARVFTGAPLHVCVGGPADYGPTRGKLDPLIGTRVRQVLHLNLVPGLEPLLLGEFGVPARVVPADAYRAVAGEVAPAAVVPEGAALVVGRAWPRSAPVRRAGEDALHGGRCCGRRPGAVTAGWCSHRTPRPGRGTAARCGRRRSGWGWTSPSWTPRPRRAAAPGVPPGPGRRLLVGRAVHGVGAVRPPGGPGRHGTPAGPAHAVRPPAPGGAGAGGGGTAGGGARGRLDGARGGRGGHVARWEGADGCGAGRWGRAVGHGGGDGDTPARARHGDGNAPPDARGGAGQAPVRAELGELLAALSFTMRPRVHPALRGVAERYLGARARDRRWFPRGRLTALGLPGVCRRGWRSCRAPGPPGGWCGGCGRCGRP